jgi:hypothetical protein
MTTHPAALLAAILLTETQEASQPPIQVDAVDKDGNILDRVADIAAPGVLGLTEPSDESSGEPASKEMSRAERRRMEKAAERAAMQGRLIVQSNGPNNRQRRAQAAHDRKMNAKNKQFAARIRKDAPELKAKVLDNIDRRLNELETKTDVNGMDHVEIEQLKTAKKIMEADSGNEAMREALFEAAKEAIEKEVSQ